MSVLGWVWLTSPFILIAVISRDRRVQSLVASHLVQCRAAGCTGAVMMFLGAAAVPGALGTLIFTLGTPLTGMVVFLRRDDGDDGDDGGEDQPDLPPVDWDEFERSFWAHVWGRRSPRDPRGRSIRVLDPRT